MLRARGMRFHCASGLLVLRSCAHIRGNIACKISRKRCALIYYRHRVVSLHFSSLLAASIFHTLRPGEWSDVVSVLLSQLVQVWEGEGRELVWRANQVVPLNQLAAEGVTHQVRHDAIEIVGGTHWPDSPVNQRMKSKQITPGTNANNKEVSFSEYSLFEFDPNR